MISLRRYLRGPLMGFWNVHISTFLVVVTRCLKIILVWMTLSSMLACLAVCLSLSWTSGWRPRSMLGSICETGKLSLRQTRGFRDPPRGLCTSLTIDTGSICWRGCQVARWRPRYPLSSTFSFHSLWSSYATTLFSTFKPRLRHWWVN